MEYDVIIIGCGVTGAAAAYMLSKYRLNVAVLEAENDVAIGTSKANSAIIHAGYDPVPGTLMARLNVEGNKLVGEISEQLHVPISHCGSLVIAFSDS
ncbi:MAG: FAD-dependent oxidoreductase, partial [Oscillospiraceae bacterium]|nr:FAD-dependent oxidoreductase [Oscillospiraceae bacterium]